VRAVPDSRSDQSRDARGRGDRPSSRRWHEPAGLSGRRRGAHCQRFRRTGGHRQRRADAVRRRCRCRHEDANRGSPPFDSRFAERLTTMKKTAFTGQREYFDLVHGVTLRAIRAFSEEELAFRPAAGVRSPRELIFHIYAQEKLLAEAVGRRAFSTESVEGSKPESPANAPELAKLKTVDDAHAFADACHRTANEIASGLSDDDLARSIASPFGEYPAWRFFTFAYDEHWHHRGQLYTYLRLLGKQPPDLYGYGG